MTNHCLPMTRAANGAVHCKQMHRPLICTSRHLITQPVGWYQSAGPEGGAQVLRQPILEIAIPAKTHSLPQSLMAVYLCLSHPCCPEPRLMVFQTTLSPYDGRSGACSVGSPSPPIGQPTGFPRYRLWCLGGGSKTAPGAIRCAADRRTVRPPVPRSDGRELAPNEPPGSHQSVATTS